MQPNVKMDHMIILICIIKKCLYVAVRRLTQSLMSLVKSTSISLSAAAAEAEEEARKLSMAKIRHRRRSGSTSPDNRTPEKRDMKALDDKV